MTVTAMKEKETKVKREESKHEAFTRLMQYRMTKLGERVEQIEKCFNSSSYEWTEAEAEAVINALFDHARRIKSLAERSTRKGGFVF